MPLKCDVRILVLLQQLVHRRKYKVLVLSPLLLLLVLVVLMPSVAAKDVLGLMGQVGRDVAVFLLQVLLLLLLLLLLLVVVVVVLVPSVAAKDVFGLKN